MAVWTWEEAVTIPLLLQLLRVVVVLLGDWGCTTKCAAGSRVAAVACCCCTTVQWAVQVYLRVQVALDGTSLGSQRGRT